MLFAEALSEGPISSQERQRLDLAASALGIDAMRLARLEAALLAAYEARSAPVTTATAKPDSLAERESMRPRKGTMPEVTEAEPRPGQAARRGPIVLKSGIPLPFAPEPDANAELHERFLTAQLDDKFRVAAVLARRHLATDHESAIHEAHRPRSPLRPMQALTAEAWSNHLLHPEQDRVTGEIFSVIASAALLGRVSAMRRDRSLPKLDPDMKQDPATSTVSATRALTWASATMGMKEPTIYLAPDTDSGMDVVISLPPALRIGSRMLRGQSAIALAFHCGRVLSWFRSEHFVCTLVPHLAYLEDLFLAALRIGAPALPMPAEVRARVDVVRDAILPVLEPAQIASLRFHVSAFVERGGRTNLRAWAHAAELTACRAGLLLCGDLHVATAIVASEPNGQERIDDLEAFWTSEHCASLRAQLGFAIV